MAAAKDVASVLRDGQRGRLTGVEDRKVIITAVLKAVSAGARLRMALNEIPLSLRTWRRWQKSPEDQWPLAIRPTPANRFKPVNSGGKAADADRLPPTGYASLPPSQIVSRLTDEGVYLASESTFYRVLRRHGEVHHRGGSAGKHTT